MTEFELENLFEVIMELAKSKANGGIILKLVSVYGAEAFGARLAEYDEETSTEVAA